MAIGTPALAVVVLTSCPDKPEAKAEVELIEEVESLDLNELRLAEEDAWWTWQEARAQLAWGEQEGGNFSEARALFEAVLHDLPEDAELESGEFVAALLDGLGRACQGLGDLKTAKDHLLSALELRENLENGDELVAQSRGHLGMLALVSGKYEESRSWIEGAMELVDGDAGGTRVFCLGLQGRYHMTMRNYGAASRSYDEAIALAKELYEEGPVIEDLEFDRIIVTLRSQGSEAALREISEIDFDQKVEGTRLAARLNLRAEIWREAGDFEKAEEDLREGIAVLEKALGEDNEALAVYWANLGAVLSDQEEWAEAKECFENVENLAKQSGDWHQTRVEALWGRIWGHIRLGEEEVARALLADGMARAEELMAQAAGHSSEGAKLNFRARFDPFSILVELKEWRWLAELLITHKARLVRDEEEKLTWVDLQKSLPPGKLFVDTLRYRNGDGEWCYGGLLCSSDSPEPRWVALGRERRLGRLALLQKSLGSLARGQAGLGVEPILRDLYDDFWSPLKGAILAGTRKVTLSSDGALGLIPWAALRSEDGRFLCEELAEFRLVSSARKVLDSEETLVGKERVAFGLSDFSEHRNGESDRWWSEVADLPGVRQELQKVGGELYEDEEATEARLRGLSKTPGVLHLATHGVFEGRAGEGGEGLDFEKENQRGAILLHPGDGEDGILRIGEIESLALDGCSLVSVSSCQSGLGGMVSGEGVIGVSRAFLKAGAEQVMVTLWEIGDIETPDFIGSFYERAMTMSPEKALWQLQGERLQGAGNIAEAVLRYGGFSMSR